MVQKLDDLWSVDDVGIFNYFTPILCLSFSMLCHQRSFFTHIINKKHAFTNDLQGLSLASSCAGYNNNNKTIMAQGEGKMSHRSISLPKVGHSDEARRLGREMTKVKWSMAPKCLLQGHDGKDILYVCIRRDCDLPTRLVCETCFFKSHQEHNCEFLALDEIKRGEVEKLRYWPFEPEFRPIYEFVNKQESYVTNMIQDVNATFHGMALRILSSIDKIRLALLKRIDNFYIKESGKREFCEKVKGQLQRSFQLKKIREVVRGIFSKQIKHDVFLQRMRTILNDQQTLRTREMLADYFCTADKGNDMFFDKMHFLKKQEWIIQQIQGQQKALRQVEVTVDEADPGVQRILPQTLAYLHKCAEGKYPLTFQKKLLEDGSQYTGFYQKGVRTMFGMRKYKNGFIYYGEWRINAKNGWGVYQNKSTGYRYAGSWKEDKKNGYGREVTPTTVYEGNFVGDKKEGYGILTEDGVRYEITWKNDKKNGAGKRIQRNGEQIEVYYLNGIESTAKSNRMSLAFNLKELTKRFGAHSVTQKTNSN